MRINFNKLAMQNLFQKKIFFVIIISGFLLLYGASFAFAISVSGPIVPCGSQGQPPCTICHIPYLIKNLADYMFTYVGIPFAILIFAIAGVRMIVGSSKESEITAAKSMITNVLIGLGFMLAAWIMVNTTMLLLTGGQTSFQGALFSGPWNQLPSTENCPLEGPVGSSVTSGPAPTPIPTPTPTPTPVQTNPLVDSILNNPRITIARDSTGDCKDTSGNRVGPQTIISQADHNRPLTVCSAGCIGQSVCAVKPGVTLNQNMLNALIAAAVPHTFTVTSLTTGSHSSNTDPHYTGDAADLVPMTSAAISFENLRKFFADSANKQLYNVDKVFCENASGIADCNKLVPNAAGNHVHVQFKR